MRLTSADNGKVFDGLGQEVDCIWFEPGCEYITVRNYKVRSKTDGVYFEDGVHHCIVEDCDIQADYVGVYLDTGSNQNTVRRNQIHDCGYWWQLDKWPHKFPRMGLDKREGIAIDDSQDNTIIDNVITRCALAGITLYRNCGEYGTPRRGEGSNRNLVAGNTIEDCPVGIWVEARKWRDLKTWGCSCPGRWVPIGDVPKQPFQQVFNWGTFYSFFNGNNLGWPIRTKLWIVPDSAKDNIVHDNVFARCDYDLR